MLPADGALPEARCQRAGPARCPGARQLPHRPEPRQVLAARLVGGEPPLQLHERARVILHDPHYYRLRSLESREYPQSDQDQSNLARIDTMGHLNSEQRDRAIEVMRQYLSAPPNPDGRKPIEVYVQLDQNRAALIDTELKP